MQGQCRAGTVCLASCSGWQVISSVHEQVSILEPKCLHETAAACSLPRTKLYSSDICHMMRLQLMSAQSDAVTDSCSFGDSAGDY